MKKFLAFLVFLAVLGAIGFGAYTFVPASVTVKVFDETYIAATPKGAEALGLKINKVVDGVVKEVKDVTDKVGNTVEKSKNVSENLEKVLPVDTLKKMKINDLIPEEVKNMNLEDIVKETSNVTISVNGSEARQLSEKEKLKLIDMVNKGNFDGIEQILNK